MLQDKDRIFTNLYGFGDWASRRARARRLGRHQGADRKGQGLDHPRDEGVRPARARRCRLPDRAQMVVHAEARSGAARPTSSSTPTSRSRARARIARSCATTRSTSSRAACSPASRWARTPATSTSAASTSSRRSGSRSAVEEAYEANLIGKDNVHGWPFDSTCTTAPAPTSAARRRRCSSRSRARRACRA